MRVGVRLDFYFNFFSIPFKREGNDLKLQVAEAQSNYLALDQKAKKVCPNPNPNPNPKGTNRVLLCEQPIGVSR